MARGSARIAKVEAFVLVGDKDYVGEAGLTAIAAPGVSNAAGGRLLAAIGDLHVCAYPPQAQSCLVKVTADDGTFGWGAICAAAATIINLICDSRSPTAAHSEFTLGASELMGFVVLVLIKARPYDAGPRRRIRRTPF